MLRRLFAFAPVLALALLVGASRPSAAVTFQDISAGMLGVGAIVGSASPLAWGDYDGDGDLDLVVAGSTNSFSSGSKTRLYRNDGASFVTVPTALPNLHMASVAWGDCDRDGDLDLAVMGRDSTNTYLARLYRNDGAGTFVDLGAGLSPLGQGGMAWGDVDGDGDLDLVMCGSLGDPSTSATRLYRNDAGTFVNASAGLPSVGNFGAIALGDIDGDGDLDLVIAGQNSAGTPTTALHRNDGGTWVALAAGLTGVAGGTSVAFGDYDGDGDLDLAVTGSTTFDAPGGTTKIYANNGAGAFTALATSLTGMSSGNARWADFDADGDLDLAVLGVSSTTASPLTFVARNDGGGVFTQTAISVPNLSVGGLEWGDYDKDGRLDLAVAGSGAANLTAVYRNLDAPLNAAPGVPTGLTATPAPGTGTSVRVTFTWSAPADDHTPANGLTYELRVGTTPGGAEVTGAAASGATGFRRVARFGGTWGRESWTLTLPPGLYYWSVQAVDGGLRGGAFAAEQSVVAQRFVDAGFTLTGAMGSAIRPALAWGDDDGDGDLDLVVSGSPTVSSTGVLTTLYRNTGGTLASFATSLPNIGNATLAWGDYDRDGDLDLALSGADPVPVRLTRLYRNDGGGTFTDIAAGLPGLASGALAWADYDRDGDLDLGLAGSTDGTSSGGLARVYRNDGGTFVDIAAGLVGAHIAALAWGDVDGDGDPDLVVSGYNSAATPTTTLYRNDGGAFTALAAGLAGVHSGAVAFGDLDTDGDLDLAVSGGTGASSIMVLYTNDGTGTFTALPGSLTGISLGGLAWGDCDGDGDLDLAFTGLTGTAAQLTRLARNDGGGAFTELDMGFLNAERGALAWGDVDGDGRLDLALAGRNGSTPFAKVYRGLGAPVNAPPSPPSGLGAYKSGVRKVLRWDPASDAKTPANGLSYDVRIGVSTRGGQVVSLPADSVSGLRRLVQRGAAQADSFVVTLPDGIYYFTVQAVDAGFAGSGLPPWQTVLGGTVGVDDAPEPAPAALAIRAIAPNPVRHSARVAFDLPREGDVDLSVYDVGGRHVATLLKARFAAGRQAAAWDGRGDDGVRLPAGVYLVRLRANGYTDTRRVVLAR